MTIYPFHSSRGCLSYLLLDEATKEAALIDPSEEIAQEKYLNTLEERGASLRYIVETHTHADHVSLAPALKVATGAQVVRHALAPSKLNDMPVQGGERITLGSTELHVLATPGHTNESISLFVDGAVFTGDALLIGGTGRTDFQLGDSEALFTSLHDVFGNLSDSTVVYPAHDYKGRTHSTIGDERLQNPRFLLPKDEFIEALNAHHPPLPELFEQSIARNSM
jgi:sulfur dioxygenase